MDLSLDPHRSSDVPPQNPWPPSMPGGSPSSRSSTYSGEDDELMIAARGSTSSRVVRVYSLLVGSTLLQFLIAIVPTPNNLNHYTFSLSLKAGGVHRCICAPVTLRLAFDPRDLEFSVFMFPPNGSLPKHSLYSLRVWLRREGIDHRIFSDESLWIGTDLDFRAIPDAKFAQAVHNKPDEQIYEAQVGLARVTFIVRWQWLHDSVFSFSFEYEAGGVGRVLFENFVLRLDCAPHQISCCIYTIPLRSRPPGASHRLRVWLKSASIFNSEDDKHQSFVYQRVWTSDDFKVGADLDFGSIDRRVIVGKLIERPTNLRINTG